MLTSNAVKRLGKKLRDGHAGYEELRLLDEYRTEFEPFLLDTYEKISFLLNSQLKFIVAGRMKRTKSIIRKLTRDPNSGMDLSRMSDLVGLRIIVKDIADQNKAIILLSSGLSMIHEPYDYRDRTSGYRAVHLIVGKPSHRVEIQIRTLSQHLWADESERFGEQVKEGNMSEEVAEHLREFNQLSRQSDAGIKDDTSFNKKALFWRSTLYRRAVTFEAVTDRQNQSLSKSYVVVYHQTTNTLLRVESFSPSERRNAVEFFNLASKTYDSLGYDILVLNSPSRKALALTHPRYFPEN